MSELLVVIDMQNDFITGALGTEEAKAVVPKVCEKIEGWKDDIILTRDTHHDNYMDTAEGKMLPVPHCLEGTDGWQINEDVNRSYEKMVGMCSGHFFSIVDKPTFGSMDLTKVIELEGKKYDRIVLCGVCTDICARPEWAVNIA